MLKTLHLCVFKPGPSHEHFQEIPTSACVLVFSNFSHRYPAKIFTSYLSAAQKSMFNLEKVLKNLLNLYSNLIICVVHILRCSSRNIFIQFLVKTKNKLRLHVYK